MSKFKKGDKVRIIAKNTGHPLNLYSLQKIHKVRFVAGYDNLYYYLTEDGWAFNDEECAKDSKLLRTMYGDS